MSTRDSARLREQTPTENHVTMVAQRVLGTQHHPTNGLHLSGYILAEVTLLLYPRESDAGNQQRQTAFIKCKYFGKSIKQLYCSPYMVRECRSGYGKEDVHDRSKWRRNVNVMKRKPNPIGKQTINR